MSNKRGRPPIDDRAALRRLAEQIVVGEQKGARCSTRSAILKTSDSVPGNSPDAAFWRLQRKWRRDGPAFLAEARERRAIRRYATSVPPGGAFLGGSTAVGDFVRALQSGRDFQSATGRLAELHDNATAALRSLACGRQNEAMRVALRMQDELAAFESETSRARRELEQLLGRRW